MINPIQFVATTNSLRSLKNESKVISISDSALDLIVYDHAQIKVPSQGLVRILNVKDIVYVKAESNYSTLYTTDGRSHLTSRTLKHWESLINSSYFIRIHKSFMANKFHVTSISIENSTLTTTTDAELPLARSKKIKVLSLF